MIHKRNDKLDFIKIKNFSSKDMILMKERENKPETRRKYAKHISDKGLVFRIRNILRT